ncbi:hypothetical protein LCGC14_1707580 [marine sediment metagenome]|uniref:Uncharacterized protein n=1 Tax=marine sediment metagenome TaxID=412755 RepID=A0A0F9HFQ5_9ZZZZ
MKTLPKFADIIGLYADDENDVSKRDLRQFTSEQIEEYCKEMEGLSMAEQVRPRIEQVEQGVRIIRQLQGCQTTNHPSFVP